jgi:hypothetical protein
MSNKNHKSKQNKSKEEKIHFDFTSFPFIDRPRTSTLLIIFLVFLSLLLRWFIQNALLLPITWFWVSMLLILISIWSYFIPSRYIFYDTKVVAKYVFMKVQRPYKDFGCFYSDKHGVMLSTFKTPRRLDPFRGMSIRYSKDQLEKKELLDFLAIKIGKRY